jgi:hypothetical protein
MDESLLRIQTRGYRHLKGIYTSLGEHIASKGKTHYLARVCICDQTEVTPFILHADMSNVPGTTLFPDGDFKMLFHNINQRVKRFDF